MEMAVLVGWRRGPDLAEAGLELREAFWGQREEFDNAIWKWPSGRIDDAPGYGHGLRQREIPSPVPQPVGRANEDHGRITLGIDRQLVVAPRGTQGETTFRVGSRIRRTGAGFPVHVDDAQPGVGHGLAREIHDAPRNPPRAPHDHLLHDQQCGPGQDQRGHGQQDGEQERGGISHQWTSASPYPAVGDEENRAGQCGKRPQVPGAGAREHVCKHQQDENPQRGHRVGKHRSLDRKSSGHNFCHEGETTRTAPARQREREVARPAKRRAPGNDSHLIALEGEKRRKIAKNEPKTPKTA